MVQNIFNGVIRKLSAPTATATCSAYYGSRDKQWSRMPRVRDTPSTWLNLTKRRQRNACVHFHCPISRAESTSSHPTASELRVYARHLRRGRSDGVSRASQGHLASRAGRDYPERLSGRNELPLQWHSSWERWRLVGGSAITNPRTASHCVTQHVYSVDLRTSPQNSAVNSYERGLTHCRSIEWLLVLLPRPLRNIEGLQFWILALFTLDVTF